MKYIYVFGAGASAVSAWTPLGKDLVWNYHADCANLVPVNNGVPDLHEENERFEDFYQFLNLARIYYPEFQSLPTEWENRGLEIINLYDKIEKKHYIDEMLEILKQNNDEQGISLVRKLIFKHLVESSKGSPNILYKIFAKEILAKSTSQQVTIISFNFDYLLQEDCQNHIYYDYLLKFNWIDPNRKENYARCNPIKLIKLNGSLDWGICPSCNHLSLYFPHMSRSFYDNNRCSICGEQIQPFIFIPNIPHEKYKALIKPLWSIAENELKQADIVTVIGYSFPEYDKEVIDLFSRSLSSNTQLEVIDHLDRKEDIYSKKNSILTKYKRIFPESKVNIDLDGFEGYLEKSQGAS